MSHVDDGELTAYADGAFPANDPDALRISEHLSTCDNCRARLRQSESLRNRASEILAFATPMSVNTPAFEALQAQAATTTRKPRFVIPLTWAASIMLAVGLGWFGRGALNQDPIFDAQMATREVSSAPAEAPPPAIVEETQAVAPASEIARGRAGNAAAPETDMAAAAPAPTPSIAAAPPAAPPSLLADQKLELAEIVVTGAAAQLQQPEYIDADEASRRGMTVPRIEGVPVKRIGVLASGFTVEHTLPDQKIVTLRVTQYPGDASREGQAFAEVRKSRSEAAAAARVGAPTADALTISVVRGTQLVTLHGDLPLDSLRVLAEKIK